MYIIYLTTYSSHVNYGYIVSGMWLRTIEGREGNVLFNIFNTIRQRTIDTITDESRCRYMMITVCEQGIRLDISKSNSI